MSGVCSAHRFHDRDCPQCKVPPLIEKEVVDREDQEVLWLLDVINKHRKESLEDPPSVSLSYHILVIGEATSHIRRLVERRRKDYVKKVGRSDLGDFDDSIRKFNEAEDSQ